MSENNSKQFPYRTLGYQLRSLREKQLETIADVSGAVEIESNTLANIESGANLPSEDILLLLISHFGLKNEEAMKLWKLAGYDNLINSNLTPDNTSSSSQQSMMLLLPLDVRVVYTDSVQISVNNYGIVMDFRQNNGQNNPQSNSVTRVGMSHEYAKNMIELLQEALTKKDSANTKSSNKPNKTLKKKEEKSDN